MASRKLLEGLNKAIAREMGVTIQYMWQHVMALGMESPAIKDLFKDTAITEMKHAEDIAERLFYLGGTPTTTPTPIKVGGTLKEMLQADLKAENEAIEMYRGIIKDAIAEGDPVTRLLFEKILSDEEDHADEFMTTLGIR
jgi:bacterioferritin